MHSKRKLSWKEMMSTLSRIARRGSRLFSAAGGRAVGSTAGELHRVVRSYQNASVVAIGNAVYPDLHSA